MGALRVLNLIRNIDDDAWIRNEWEPASGRRHDVPSFSCQESIRVSTTIKGDHLAHCCITLPSGTRYLSIRARGHFCVDPNKRGSCILLKPRNGVVNLDLTRLTPGRNPHVFGPHIRGTELSITHY